MKKLIVIRFEGVIVNDFNPEDAFTREIRKEMKQIEINHGIASYQDVLRDIEKKHKKTEIGDEEYIRLKERFETHIDGIKEEIKDLIAEKERKITEHTKERRRQFSQENVGKSHLRKGIDVLLEDLLNVFKTNNMGVQLVVISNYSLFSVRSVLYKRGILVDKAYNSDDAWIDKILRDTGKTKNEIILFSNKSEDLLLSRQGIKVEKLRAPNGIKDVLNKIGLKSS